MESQEESSEDLQCDVSSDTELASTVAAGLLCSLDTDDVDETLAALLCSQIKKSSNTTVILGQHTFRRKKKPTKETKYLDCVCTGKDASNSPCKARLNFKFRCVWRMLHNFIFRSRSHLVSDYHQYQ